MHAESHTPDEYLAQLPPQRREALAAVRKVVCENLPAGYEEAMNWGMITYQVPLEVFPDTYNGKPLMYAALASQKNHMAVYLTSVYLSEHSAQQFEAAYKATGKRMDMGKSCVRFRKLDDLPLELIGKTVASVKVQDFVNQMKKLQFSRARRRKS